MFDKSNFELSVIYAYTNLRFQPIMIGKHKVQTRQQKKNSTQNKTEYKMIQ